MVLSLAAMTETRPDEGARRPEIEPSRASIEPSRADEAGGFEAAVHADDTSRDDRELLGRIRLGDEAALARLYDRYNGLVYALALRVVGDRDLAEEILQDTFMRCWDGAERYDAERGRVAAWLMGVARNRAIDVLRGRQHQARLREREPLVAEGRAEPGVPDATEAVVLHQVVTGALAALSASQREAIELAYYGGLSQADVARVLDAPLGTVKTRMRDGLRRLRDLLLPLADADVGPRHGPGDAP